MNSRQRDTTPTALFRQGRWRQELVETSLHRAQASGQACDWIDYLDICHALRGITLALWRHVAERYADQPLHSPKLLLRLLYLLLTPGLIREITAAERNSCLDLLYTRARARWLDGLSDVLTCGYLGTRVAHYPGLSASTEAPFQPVLPGIMATGLHHRQALRLKSLTQSFESLIGQLLSTSVQGVSQPRSARVAVVGNSATILENRRGAEIDSADLVIRFNNASIQADMRKHTGRRTDLWVMSPSTPIRHCPHDARAILVSGLHALNRASFFWPELVRLNRPLGVCPPEAWHSLVSRFSAPPSAGTLLLASLQALGLDVRCHGFTTNGASHQQQPNHHNDNTMRSGRHNWQAEASWLGNSISQGEVLVIPGK